jgi:hypothetical protein
MSFTMDIPRTPGLKTISSDLLGQSRTLTPLLFLIYTPLLLLLVTLVIANLVTDIPMRWFFIDPVAEFNAPMYIGLVSNFGVLCWGAAASVCLFGGWLSIKSGNHRTNAWFLISAGLISTILMLDDLYLLHEEVLPDHAFIPQKLVFVGYGVMVLAFLIRFRDTIFQSDYLLLILAFGFFAISVGVDLFVEPEEFTIFGGFPGRHIIEDGFKLLGIATWSVYLIRTSMQKVAPLVRTQ